MKPPARPDRRHEHLWLSLPLAVFVDCTSAAPPDSAAPMDVSPAVDSGASGDATTPTDAASVLDAFDAPDITFSATPGTVVTVATHADLAGLGFAWGPSDGTMGARAVGDGGYVFYGSASSSASCAGEAANVQGAYSVTGTLDHIAGSNGCVALFQRGEEPAGWVFDRDYAGGGQVFPFTSGAQHGWWMSFHAELHWSNPNSSNGLCDNVPCFYGTLGLAVSTDGGNTFTVAGETIQPNQSIQAFQGGGTNMAVGYGSMILADTDGIHLPNPPPDPSSAFVYLFYQDQTPGLPGVCATGPCAAVARASYGDLAAAALSGDPTRVAGVFHKYFSGGSTPWSEPGTSGAMDQSADSGRFTPLWSDEGAQSPSVLFDNAIGAYLITYTVRQNGLNVVRLRASTDLLHWSTPLIAYSETGRMLMYPTLIGETGNPLIGGPMPRIYFSTFATFPMWGTALMEALPVAVSAH